MNWETILCIGDSITIGARSYLGYPEYLGHYLQAKTGSNWNVINHAVSGYNCRDICRHLNNNYPVVHLQNPSVATILIGTNDVKQQTELDAFAISYEALIVKTKLLVPHNNIILIKIPLLAVGVKYPYKFSMNKVIPKYNSIIVDLAKKYNLKTVELTTEPAEFYDGVHLNEAGSKSYAKQILKTILSEKGYEDITD